MMSSILQQIKMAKPDPNKPITHINPPTVVPDRVMPLKPGALETVVVPETEANPDKPAKPRKPRK
jgi:hypothetical protein